MAASKDADTELLPRLNLYQKLAKITGEVGVINKDGNNEQQKFKFIEYAAVAGRLRDLFAKYGVVIVPRMAQQAKQKRELNGKAESVLIDFTYTVINADKPDDKFTVTWTGQAIDYGDKATNKAATSALKYYLMRQFNISEKGDDPDADSPTRPDTAKKPAVGTAPPPVTPPAPPGEPSISQGQAAMLLGYVKQQTGLTEREAVIAAVEEAAGAKVTDIKQRDLEAIKAMFGPVVVLDEDAES